MTVTSINDKKRALAEDLMTKGFKLGGSRFLGTDHAKSDWDLFAEYTDEKLITIESLGFIKTSSRRGYYDDNTISIYNKILETDSEDEIDVEVVFVIDAEKKQGVLDFLKADEDWRNHDKNLKNDPRRVDFWNFLYFLWDEEAKTSKS